MARGNKKDPSYVVIRITISPLLGTIRNVKTVHTFDAREDARTFAAEKNKRSRSHILYRVQRATPGPINRSK